MKIISATYGGTDVKGIVESKIKGDALVLRASNSIFGDTSVGNVKFLEIKAELGGEIYHKLIRRFHIRKAVAISEKAFRENERRPGKGVINIGYPACIQNGMGICLYLRSI
jgi:hypothetical protein